MTKQSMLCIQTPQFGCFPISNTRCFSQHIPDGNKRLQRKHLCLNAPQLTVTILEGRDIEEGEKAEGGGLGSGANSTFGAPRRLKCCRYIWLSHLGAPSHQAAPRQGCCFRPQRNCPSRCATAARVGSFLHHPR